MRIVTHKGTFHADELLAIATVREFAYPDAKVIRTYEVADYLSSKKHMVLDIGREFNPLLLNFDHHQNAKLPATNMLVLEHFCTDKSLKAILKDRLFQYVSDVDCGKIVDGKDGIPTFNTIIRSLNTVDGGFKIALNIAEKALAGAIATAKLQIKGEKRWKALEKIASAKINPETTTIPNWRDLAEAEGVNYLVSPNLRGGWQIISRDSDAFPIPEDDSQTFRHNSGFLAIYPDKEKVLTHLLKLL